MTLVTIESARAALVEYALSCVGLSAHPSNAPAAFGRAVAPCGPPAWVASLCAPTPPNGANSTCEVFAVGTEQEVARRLGIAGHDHPLDGAVSQWAREVALAKLHGAYRTIAKDGPPTVGAIVHVESASSRHWYRVVEARSGVIAGAWNFVTVDGGQNDRGYQAIAKCQRGIRGGFEVLGNGSLGRTVVDWIDSPALLVALAKVIPEGSSDPVAIPTGSDPLPSVTLRRGASGQAVKRWQSIIGVTQDGQFGPATEAATKGWQARHGLTPDGVVGARSWATAISAGQPEPAAPPTRHEAPSVAPIEGIDVSSIQGVIDWKRVAAVGIRFVYVRALIGRDDVDRLAASNCAGALAAGLEVGVYGVVYPRHGKPQDTDIQARQLATFHWDHGCTLRPAPDFESLDGNASTPQEWLAALDGYCDALDDAGLSPLLYTYPSFWRSMSGWTADARWAEYPLWIAHYTSAPQPDVPPPWTKALVWQYAASAPGFEGRVDGVPALVDRNRLFGSIDDLRAK